MPVFSFGLRSRPNQSILLILQWRLYKIAKIGNKTIYSLKIQLGKLESEAISKNENLATLSVNPSDPYSFIHHFVMVLWRKHRKLKQPRLKQWQRLTEKKFNEIVTFEIQRQLYKEYLTDERVYELLKSGDCKATVYW